jgi:hypothetical protein
MVRVKELPMTDEKKPPERAVVDGVAPIGEHGKEMAALLAASQKMALGMQELLVRVKQLDRAMERFIATNAVDPL